jgi:lysozyme
MTARLRTSRAGLELIKSFEGFRESAVRLPDGRYTIGYGHVRTAREGLTVSPKDAEDLLVYDLGAIESAINTMVFAPLNQNQFDALVSLTYNISPGQFRDSDIIAYLNAGDFLSAANAFDLWRKARIHGRVMVVDALVRRRAAEKAMFLEHPDGRPSAPTPLVSPTRDTSGDELPAANQNAEPIGKPRPVERAATPEATPPASGNQEPSVNIAEAVRRLSERMNEILAAAGKPVPQAQMEEEIAEAVGAVAPAPEPQPEAPHTPPRTADEIEIARRAVAERVARILERTERAIAEQQEEPVAPQPVAPPRAPQPQVRGNQIQGKPQPRPAPSPDVQVRAAAQPKPEKIVQDIPQDLPDFDKPAEPRISPSNGRRFIDDTETFDPGRDPAEIFAEAEKKARVVNGRSKNLGLINGRWVMLWPWIFILILAGIAFTIGIVETTGNMDGGMDAPKWAPTVLAVFGMLMLMAVYFMVTRSSDSES